MSRLRGDFSSNVGLVDYLRSQKTIRTKAVIDAMKRVDRHDFVPSRARPYQDSPQYIGFGATISAPHMHGHALEQLADCLKPGMKALDVGSGSGILSAYMCHMVAPPGSSDNGSKSSSDSNNNNNDDDEKNLSAKDSCAVESGGKVVGIEHMSELVQYSLKNLNKNEIHQEWLKNGTLTIVEGDGRQGYSKEAPFDCVHVGAAAQENVIQTLFDQLKIGGMMVIPVELMKEYQVFRLYVKDAKKMDKKEGKILAKDCFKDLLDVRYVPLTDHDTQAKSA